MCTKNGSMVWLFLYSVFNIILLVELAALKAAWDAQPALASALALRGTIAVFGVGAGIELLRQGLTNAEFVMPMRITLVSAGFIATGAAIIFGMLPASGLA